MSDMTHISPAEFQRAFGTLSDKAMKQPVALDAELTADERKSTQP
jgi:hypothetical protein